MNLLQSLRGHQAFQEIKAEGKVFEGEFLRFFYVCRRSGSDLPRVAFIVSKRYGKAVNRNLIKRRIREAYRQAIVVRGEELKNMGVTISSVVLYKGSKRVHVAKVTFAEIMKDVFGFLDAIQSSPESDN